MSHIEVAKNVFRTEIQGLNAVLDDLGFEFTEAVETILSTRGRVIVCGMGKSGIIGKKISATFASTGTQSYFIHPGEAFHGDLGMVDPEDIFIGISYSGETDELLKLLPFLKKNGNKFVAITGNAESTLAKFATVHLCVRVPEEACPLQLAPTASTTATLVMGDALAVALMQKKEFTDSDFAVFHPGGSLGRRLLSTVSDEMRTENLPVVETHTKFADVVSAITIGGLGFAIVELDEKRLGVITDGDLRRVFEKHSNRITHVAAEEMASMDPICIDASASLAEAWEKLDKYRVSALLVFGEGRFRGVYKR
jgi:arabinose-5-phosphate isomerase